MPTVAKEKWLLIFYSVPSQPVSNRMKIWRKLAKTGAVQLKGAVYILPNNEEHYELFQWLISQVTSMGGDGAFVKTSQIETLEESEIITLFNLQREQEYLSIEKKIEDLEMKLSSSRKGGRSQNDEKLQEQLNKHKKEFADIRRVDFFSSKRGEILSKRIKAVEAEIKGMSAPAQHTRPPMLLSKRIEDYQNKTWVTRKNPFIDRMASAWFVRRFIDKAAIFIFIAEQEFAQKGKDGVTFDIQGGAFTHVDDLCTFEVMVKSFGIKDKIVKKIAEMVHELDVKDGKYDIPEAQGIEKILTGIRKTSKSDHESLERGMEVFEMLYASKS